MDYKYFFLKIENKWEGEIGLRAGRASLKLCRHSGKTDERINKRTDIF